MIKEYELGIKTIKGRIRRKKKKTNTKTVLSTINAVNDLISIISKIMEIFKRSVNQCKAMRVDSNPIHVR